MSASERKIKSDYLLECLTSKELEQFDKYIKSKLDGSGVRILNFWQVKFSTLRNPDAIHPKVTFENFSRKTISDFVRRSMSRSCSACALPLIMVKALPDLPALPVLPMRWT